jgi:hypothetical protein
MVAYLRTHLVKTVTLAPGDTITALSETAVRFNDTTWFWTDDNAKAAELLCEPTLYNQDSFAANAAIDFILRMSQGDIINRRSSAPELRVLSADPAAFRIETGFTIIEGDLTRGIVRHALRFNDNRTVTAAQHAPAPLCLRHGWRPLRFAPAAGITAYAITTTPTTATLSHTTTLHRPTLRPDTPPIPLGTLRYTYTIAALYPSITLTLELIPTPGTVLENVVLGTALEGLDQVGDVHYRTVAVRQRGADRFIGNIQGRNATLHQDGADYAAVIQGGASPGFSYAIHSLLPDGAKLARITAREHKRGRLHRLRHIYRLGRVQAPGASITEHRMVTGGGYYDTPGHYAAIMGQAEGAAHGRGQGTADPSMTYDIGAELNAVAVHLLFARWGKYTIAPDPARLETLTVWYDRHVQRYFDFIRPGAPDALDRVFTRGIAFVVLSLDCMLRATNHPRYRALLATGVRLILATQRRHPGEPHAHTTFGDPWSGHHPFLDNHAACILALARAAWHGDPDAAIAGTVHEAIRGIRLHTGTIDIGGGHLVAYDGLAVLDPSNGRRPDRPLHVDTGFWNYKLGLTLRALHATLAAADAGILPITAEQRLQTCLRIDLARHQLASSFRHHGPQLEILTSRLAGETNSETQPWVALGLIPILDQQITAQLPPQ